MIVTCAYCGLGIATTEDKVKEVIRRKIVCPKTMDYEGHLFLREGVNHEIHTN